MSVVENSDSSQGTRFLSDFDLNDSSDLFAHESIDQALLKLITAVDARDDVYGDGEPVQIVLVKPFLGEVGATANRSSRKDSSRLSDAPPCKRSALDGPPEAELALRSDLLDDIIDDMSCIPPNSLFSVPPWEQNVMVDPSGGGWASGATSPVLPQPAPTKTAPATTSTVSSTTRPRSRLPRDVNGDQPRLSLPQPRSGISRPLPIRLVTPRPQARARNQHLSATLVK